MLDKIKKIIEENPFLNKNKRYLGVAVLLVCFVVMLVFFTGDAFNEERKNKENSVTVSGEDYVPDSQFEIDAYTEINNLIEKYFVAYANADFATLESIVTPFSEMEKSYITTMSPFYEAYENIVCYTKHGLSKDSYIVSACFNIRFAEVEATAPSMVLFYIQTAEDGSLYINNLYSDFNLMYLENPIDTEVYTALRKYTTQDDYIELYNTVEYAYQKLMKEDDAIYQMTKRTIPGTRQIWEDTVFYADATEEVPGTEDSELTPPTETPQPSETTQPSEDPQPSETTQPSEEPQPSETPSESESEQVTKRVKISGITGLINIRQKADASSADIGDAYLGDVFVKLGVENDASGDEWTKVQLEDGSIGYIKSAFLEEI